MSLRTIFNQVQAVNLDRAGIFEEQAFIEMSESDLTQVRVILHPRYGPFAGAEVKFLLQLPEQFPEKPPTSCTCLTKIFHPNVSFSGGVCFNLFNTEWSPGMPISTFVVGLLWFLSNPNPDSALNSFCSVQDPKEYEKHVLSAMIGDKVKGHAFEPHLNPDMPPHLRARLAEISLAQIIRLAGDRPSYPLSALHPLPAALEAVQAVSPSLAEIIKLPAGSRPLRITERVKLLTQALDVPVEPQQVMKELIFLAAGRPLLLLTSGPDSVDLASLAELLDLPPDSIILPSRYDLAAFFADQMNGLYKFSPLRPAEWPHLFSAQGQAMQVVLDERMSLQPHLFVSYGDYFIKLETAALFRLLPNLTSGFVATRPPLPQAEASPCRRGMEKRSSFYFPASMLALYD